jgi:nicotinamide-nucleotide amidase
VILTGGLGPTPDDLTRGVVADTLGRPLETRDEVLEHIRDRVRRAGRPMPASVEEMARVPRGATVWRNSVGSAPGVLIEHEGRFVVLLPGPPSELRALTDEHLLPWLRERSTQEVAVVTLHTFGIFESQLHARIAGLSDGWPGARLAYLPGPGGVDLRVTVSAPRGSGRAEGTVSRGAPNCWRASATGCTARTPPPWSAWSARRWSSAAGGSRSRSRARVGSSPSA